jgi:hypothetical protein
LAPAAVSFYPLPGFLNFLAGCSAWKKASDLLSFALQVIRIASPASVEKMLAGVLFMSASFDMSGFERVMQDLANAVRQDSAEYVKSGRTCNVIYHRRKISLTTARKEPLSRPSNWEALRRACPGSRRLSKMQSARAHRK